MEVEIIILPSGSVLLPRGEKPDNDLIRGLIDGVVANANEVEAFLSVTDDIELLFGQTTHCG